MGFDAYLALGVTSDATAHELRSAYRHLARALHPDANAGDPVAAARFRQVAQAYEILGDPERRREYDLLRAAPRPGPRATRHAPGPTGNVAVRVPTVRGEGARPEDRRPVPHSPPRPQVDEWSFLSAFVRWASVVALAAIVVIVIAATVYGNDQPAPGSRPYTGSPGGPGFCHTGEGWVACRLLTGPPSGHP
jgi:DnaJ domain